MVATRAVKAGATLWTGTEAVEPVADGGLVTGAVVRRRVGGTHETVHARYVVVADGAHSRFGRALGTPPDRTYPLGPPVPRHFPSPNPAHPRIECPPHPPR